MVASGEQMPTVCSPHFLLAPTHPWPYIQEMTTFTGTGVSATSVVTVVGSTTVTLTNTSSFIGTVFIGSGMSSKYGYPYYGSSGPEKH